MRIFLNLASGGLLACLVMLVSCDKGSELSRSDNSSKASKAKQQAEKTETTSRPQTPQKVTTNRTDASKPTTPSAVKPKPVAPPKPKTKIDLLVEKRYPMPTFMTLNDITKNWTNVPVRAFPETVKATSQIQCNMVKNGQLVGSTVIKPGTKLKPIGLIGNKLTVASLKDQAIRTQVLANQTDFKLSIENNYNRLVNDHKNKILNLQAKAKAALLAKPDRVSKFTRAPSASSAVVAPEILAAVKSSIKRGQAGSTKIDEAKSFRWNGTEEIGGGLSGTYDTVSVHFEVRTIFGAFPTEYKCLLSNGNVKGWIDPITEENVSDR